MSVSDAIAQIEAYLEVTLSQPGYTRISGSTRQTLLAVIADLRSGGLQAAHDHLQGLLGVMSAPEQARALHRWMDLISDAADGGGDPIIV